MCVGATSSAVAEEGIAIGKDARSFGVGSIAIGARAMTNVVNTP